MFVSICNRLAKIRGMEKAFRMLYQLFYFSTQKPLQIEEEEIKKKLEKAYIIPKSKVSWNRKAPQPCVDLSIIIPFYKTERYARRCIESVISQNSQFSVEVILVDDGSPDNCGSIIDDYMVLPNVVVVHQKNAGLSAARNTGLQIASGKYVLFLDSDDILLPSSIQILMNNALKYDADIVEGGYYTFSDKRKRKEYRNHFRISEGGEGMTGYACFKVYRASLFDSVCFPNGLWYEDTIIAGIIFPKARTTVCLNEIIAGYYVNPSGITAQTKKNNKCIDTLFAVKLILDYYVQNNKILSEKLLRGIRLQLGPYLFFRTRGLSADLQYGVFLAASNMAKDYGLLEIKPDDCVNYYEKELIIALRDRQFKRWKWASILM